RCSRGFGFPVVSMDIGLPADLGSDVQVVVQSIALAPAPASPNWSRCRLPDCALGRAKPDPSPVSLPPSTSCARVAGERGAYLRTRQTLRRPSLQASSPFPCPVGDGAKTKNAARRRRSSSAVPTAPPLQEAGRQDTVTARS